MSNKEIERVEAEYTNIPEGDKAQYLQFEILKALLRIAESLEHFESDGVYAWSKP